MIARKQIVVTPIVKKGAAARGEDLLTVELPDWRLVSENEDGTWTIDIPVEPR